MEFYSNGSEVGVVFSGIAGFIILTYLIIEIFSLVKTKMFLLHRLYIWFRVKKYIKNEIPNYWSLQKLGLPKLDTYKTTNIYVSFKRNLEGYKDKDCNSIIESDLLGRVKENSLADNLVKFHDKDLSKEVKTKHNRDKKLEKLGI